MNNRERVRKLALESEGNIWIRIFFVGCVEGLILLSGQDVMRYIGVPLGFLLLGLISSQGGCLAKEIIRLKKKVENLETRIP